MNREEPRFYPSKTYEFILNKVAGNIYMEHNYKMVANDKKKKIIGSTDQIWKMILK